MWWSDLGGSFNSTPASPLLSDEAGTIIGLTANLEWDQIHRQGDQTYTQSDRSRKDSDQSPQCGLGDASDDHV
jgi:predicted acylesterase/phospholipase RssA